jgi:hypothetical protein
MVKQRIMNVLWQHEHQKELTSMQICDGLKIAFMSLTAHSSSYTQVYCTAILCILHLYTHKWYSSIPSHYLLLYAHRPCITLLEGCIMRSSIICALHHILLEWANQGGWDGYKILVVKPEWKKPRWGARRMWEDNIKMDLWEIGLGWGLNLSVTG